MKKLFAIMFGLSLLALFLLSGDSRTIAVDDAGLQLLTHCGECEKDDEEDGSEEKSRLLADCGKDHGEEDGDDEDKDGSKKKSRLLAHCGECGEKDDHDDDDDHHDDDEESLV
ncbi:MAG: hypothetical protein IH831_03435 [Planctomycetes bacterium]|nr:hypothetical protein [Planctomycetota bacterium]